MRVKLKTALKFTTKETIERFKVVHGDKYDYSEEVIDYRLFKYNNTTSKLP